MQVYLDATAQGTDGSTVTAYQGQFTVTSNPTTITPAPISYSPASGATNVPLNAIVDVAFDAPLTTASLNSNNVYLYTSGARVPSALSLDATGTTLTLKPTAAFPANTQICLYGYSLMGTNGQQAQGFSACFTTGTASLTTTPTVLAVSPPSKLTNVPVNANISVEFSAPVDPVSVTGATIKVTGGGQTVIPISMSFTRGNQAVSITPEAPLPISTVMTIAVSGVTDVAGNTVTPSTTNFTTGTTPTTGLPVAIVFNPPASTTGVPLNAAITVQASAPLDPTSVVTGALSLYDYTQGKYLTGSLTQSADWTTVYLLPGAPLSVERTYQITVGYPICCITDLAGNSLQAYATFTSGSTSSTTAPQVTGISPPNAATGIALNAQIQVQFNEPVNAKTLSAITLKAPTAPRCLSPLN